MNLGFRYIDKCHANENLSSSTCYILENHYFYSGCMKIDVVFYLSYEEKTSTFISKRHSNCNLY